MTFHRWRKLPMTVEAKEKAPAIAPEQPTVLASSSAVEMARHLEELTIENRRLRKLVTDLLLDKMRMEEAAASIPPILSPAKTVAGGV
jgi:hypothetical protein